MFNFYKDKEENFELVFQLNNKITRGLIRNKILKMSDLERYLMPSSMEEIIPFAEKMTGGAKLVTDVIANILKIESFLKVNKTDFENDFLLGEDFIIVKKTYFTTNPLSNYINKLKNNLKKYDKDEVMFDKIGYISSSDFEIIKKDLEKEQIKREAKKLSNLKIESIFIDVLFKTQIQKAESVKIIYKDNEIKVQYTIERQVFEDSLVKTTLENYTKLVNYIKTFFEENVVIKEINGEKLKLNLRIGKATEEFKAIETLTVNVFFINNETKDFKETFELPLSDSKKIEQDFKNPYGLIVLSSKNNLKDSLYSLLKNQSTVFSPSKIYFIESEIEKDFKNIAQYKYKSKKEWRDLDCDGFSIVFIDEISSKEDCEFAYSLISKGKKVVVGINAPSSIEAFSKLYKWSSDREVLIDNLLSITQVEKLNTVCPNCSTSLLFLKDKNYQNFQAIEQAPTMNTLIKVENRKGCESCNKGYKGMQVVAEYLQNDLILKDALLNGFKFDSLKIEKNSASWMNIYENSMILLENKKITTNSIIFNLGYPRKL